MVMFVTKKDMVLSLLNKKGVRILVILLVIGASSLFFKTPILRSVGNHLIQEDPETYAEYTFVLGGNSLDRGMKALDIFNKKLTANLVCTGGNIPSVLAAIDTTLYEAEITAALLEKHGIPKNNIKTLTTATSTSEESEEILQYCLKNNIRKANLITSKFHLRRVRNVFEDKFIDRGISLHFIGAPSSHYNEDEWWKSEEGMIMVNNEYVKLGYYFVRGF